VQGGKAISGPRTIKRRAKGGERAWSDGTWLEVAAIRNSQARAHRQKQAN